MPNPLVSAIGLWAGGIFDGNVPDFIPLSQRLGFASIVREGGVPVGGYLITLGTDYAIDPLGAIWYAQGRDLLVASVVLPINDTQVIVETSQAFAPFNPVDCQFYLSCHRLGLG